MIAATTASGSLFQTRAGNSQLNQRPAPRQRRLFHQANDFHLLGGGVPHVSDSPPPITLFLSKRFSSRTSANNSLSCCASVRSPLTSSLVASRAVSPASRFLPASRNSLDQR